MQPKRLTVCRWSFRVVTFGKHKILNLLTVIINITLGVIPSWSEQNYSFSVLSVISFLLGKVTVMENVFLSQGWDGLYRKIV